MILAIFSANLGLGVLLFSFFFPAGCGKQYNTLLPTVQMKLGGRTFTLEVADSDPERNRGLMQRDYMPADHGMIFIFPDQQERSFWMANTRIPLDIIYLDSFGRIVSIHQMKPYDRSSTTSAAPAQYAIELNQGLAFRIGLKPGDAVSIPDQLKSASPK